MPTRGHYSKNGCIYNHSSLTSMEITDQLISEELHFLLKHASDHTLNYRNNKTKLLTVPKLIYTWRKNKQQKQQENSTHFATMCNLETPHYFLIMLSSSSKTQQLTHFNFTAQWIARLSAIVCRKQEQQQFQPIQERIKAMLQQHQLDNIVHDFYSKKKETEKEVPGQTEPTCISWQNICLSNRHCNTTNLKLWNVVPR